MSPRNLVMGSIGQLQDLIRKHKQEAEWEGYDTDKVWWHGTSRDFHRYDPNMAPQEKHSHYRHGRPFGVTYFTDNVDIADRFVSNKTDDPFYDKQRLIPNFAKPLNLFNANDQKNRTEFFNDIRQDQLSRIHDSLFNDNEDIASMGIFPEYLELFKEQKLQNNRVWDEYLKFMDLMFLAEKGYPFLEAPSTHKYLKDLNKDGYEVIEWNSNTMGLFQPNRHMKQIKLFD